jgi:hypothetical protein
MNQPFASNKAAPQAEAQKEEMRLDYKSLWQPVSLQRVLRERNSYGDNDKTAKHVKLISI